MSKLLESLSKKATRFTASSAGFGAALGLVVTWFALGPLFHYSQDWQVFINTVTTIITFLMVFLIQRAQNKDVAALHLKLNELIASQHGASNRMLNVEDKTEQELAELRELHDRLPKNSLESISLEHVTTPELILPASLKEDFN